MRQKKNAACQVISKLERPLSCRLTCGRQPTDIQNVFYLFFNGISVKYRVHLEILMSVTVSKDIVLICVAFPANVKQIANW